MTSALQFQPPVEWSWIAALAAAIIAGWFTLRLLAGRTVGLARRPGLMILRLAVVLTLVALLAGPVRVDQSPGPIRRPDVFYLLDGSQSMAIGNSLSRWEESLQAIASADTKLPDEVARRSVQQFRFGHRLSALEDSPAEASRAPTDTDTRLAEALRQLSGRFGQQPPGAVVLFSDGRARDSAAVEQLASHYGEREIPIHVYPVGDTSRGGDVAIVSIVAPPRVRKFTEVEVQVFLRSFGYSGKRTEVQLVAVDERGGPPEILSSLPVTLRGGAQSATLTYRSDMRPRTIEVRLEEQPDELSSRNNRMTTEVAIDRTKIRVLYVEGSRQPLRAVQRAGRTELVGAFTPLQEALTADEDIECVTLAELPGSTRLVRTQTFQYTGGRQGFPETVAELSAFDCIILSNVASDALTEEELQWLANWIENRGGGLCMAGGEHSFRGGAWDETPLADLLPVQFESSTWSSSLEVPVTPATERATHSIWQIVTDRQQNRETLSSIPPFFGMQTGLEPKPLTEVLAVTSAAGEQPAPVIVAGRYGRGRTLAMAVPLTGPGAEKFMHDWGPGGNRYGEKFWRNLVYWLTEGSSIGRRRLIAGADKRFYRPGETIALKAVAYDETARRTTDYKVYAMIEPQSLDLDDQSLYAPIRWPNGVPRESGEEGPHIAWGEEFELSRLADGDYQLPLDLAEHLYGGASDEGLRVELTAYENAGAGVGFGRGTQVDSTSLDIQILDDPFEQQNPFPNHDLLRRVAGASGGKVLQSPPELAAVVSEMPVESGSPIISTVPLWNRWWLLALLLGLLTTEWVWRRAIGLA